MTAGLRVVMKYVLFSCVALSFGGAWAAVTPAPGAADWAEWNRSDEQNFATIDHGVWDGLLRRYVVEGHKSGINRFRYGRSPRPIKGRWTAISWGWPSSTPHLQPRRATRLLDQSLQRADRAVDPRPLSGHRHQQDPHRRRRTPERQAGDGGGPAASLDDIEHRILMPIWKDHRVLFGLACAGLGCPDIQPRACTGPNSRELLTSAGRKFVNSDRGMSIAGARGRCVPRASSRPTSGISAVTARTSCA